MNNKILIGSIIAVAILVVMSSSSAVEYKTDDIKVTSETINNKVEPLDNGCFEIITYVEGYTHPMTIKWVGIFIYLHLEMWEYDVGAISIKAYTLNPLNPVYEANPKFIYAPLFIGSIGCTSSFDHIEGYFIGNIYWE